MTQGTDMPKAAPSSSASSDIIIALVPTIDPFLPVPPQRLVKVKTYLGIRTNTRKKDPPYLIFLDQEGERNIDHPSTHAAVPRHST